MSDPIVIQNHQICSIFALPKFPRFVILFLGLVEPMEKQLLISTGVVKNASGSAYVELGNMKILCSVHGPRDTFLMQGVNEKGKLFCDFKYAPFAKKDSYGTGGEVLLPFLFYTIGS